MKTGYVSQSFSTFRARQSNPIPLEVNTQGGILISEALNYLANIRKSKAVIRNNRPGKIFRWGLFLMGLTGGLALPAYAQDTTVNLQSTVTGNQEQPKVLYIVPWKAPSGPDSLYQSPKSQLVDVFAHVERTELKREIQYRKQLQPQHSESD